jgi:GNAT superfamily N-acetyltransferase
MIHVRPLTAADVPLGMRLKEQAGWNQTEADWARLLYLQPDGCFVAEWDGIPVGTTATCGFGRVAWVAMVLVEASARGRGVGTALMRHALDFLDGRQVPSVRLDATPLGRPLYEKLGFVPEYDLARYAGVLPPAGAAVDGVEPVAAGDLRDVIALDARTLVVNRTRLLARLYAEAPGSFRLVRDGGVVTGYLASRPGANAVQVGPCLAAPGAGPKLFADVGHRHAGARVFIDIPTGNRPAAEFAERLGLAVQRRLLRMCRGAPGGEPVGPLWASSGPEKG